HTAGRPPGGTRAGGRTRSSRAGVSCSGAGQAWSVLLGFLRRQVGAVVVYQVLIQALMRRLRQRLRLDRPVTILGPDPVLLVEPVVDPGELSGGLLHVCADCDRA